MTTELDVLIKKRNSIKKKLTRFGTIIHGTIVTMKRTCGKKECRCQRGMKHESLYLSQTRSGKQSLIYIPRKAEKDLIKWIENYNALLKMTDELSEINIQVLRLRKKTRGTGE